MHVESKLLQYLIAVIPNNHAQCRSVFTNVLD